MPKSRPLLTPFHCFLHFPQEDLWLIPIVTWVISYFPLLVRTCTTNCQIKITFAFLLLQNTSQQIPLRSYILHVFFRIIFSPGPLSRSSFSQDHGTFLCEDSHSLAPGSPSLCPPVHICLQCPLVCPPPPIPVPAMGLRVGGATSRKGDSQYGLLNSFNIW